MSIQFEKGHEIKIGDSIIIIDELIGEGGSASVYRVKKNEKNYALKWIWKKSYLLNKSYYDHCKYIMIRFSEFNNTFLFPIDITEYSENGFGLLYPLIDHENNCSLGDIILGEKNFKSYRTMISIAISFVNALYMLHSKGYCYVDMNPHNILIDPDTGDLTLCDCDSIMTEDCHIRNYFQHRYQAPEVITGKKYHSIYSDRYSMGIILFTIFCISHPLEGKNYINKSFMTTELQKKIYGENPVFIFDQYDDSNSPVPVKTRTSSARNKRLR